MATRAVWKYDLPLYGSIELAVPEGSVVLRVDAQAGHPVLWALVDVDAPKTTCRFVSMMTGQEWRDDPAMRMVYRGTAQVGDGHPIPAVVVVHVFEGKSREIAETTG